MNAAAKAELTLVAQPRQATNAAARAELYRYATLVWHHPALSLQATSMHISSLHEHVAARKNRGKSQKLVRPWPEQPDQLRRPCIYFVELNSGTEAAFSWNCAQTSLNYEDRTLVCGTGRQRSLEVGFGHYLTQNCINANKLRFQLIYN